jgi:pimeloyl-ACP methyl ester carboxylesterase
VYADDVHHLLEVTADGPAYLFASSGGATIALDLVARYPGQVRRLVAHEPPSPFLLHDADQERTNMLAVAEAFHSKGMRAAMDTFVVVARMQAEPPPPQPENPTPEWIEAMGRMQRNMSFFFGSYITAIANFRPDIAALQRNSDRVVPGVGEDSVGQVAHDGALGLAKLLGTEPAVFPGAHGGFQTHPQQFVTRLREVFESEAQMPAPLQSR